MESIQPCNEFSPNRLGRPFVNSARRVAFDSTALAVGFLILPAVSRCRVWLAHEISEPAPRFLDMSDPGRKGNPSALIALFG